jgi:excisionase family DNA binding protein
VRRNPTNYLVSNWQWLQLLTLIGACHFEAPIPTREEHILPKNQPTGTPHTSEVLLSRSDAAARLGIADRTLDRLIACGQIKANRIGRAVRIKSSEIDKFISTTACPIPGTSGRC